MTSIQPLTFGTLLKRHRRAVGLTQEALAARANFSTTYISMLERGERMPQTATVELLAEALALTPAERVTLRTTVLGQPRVPSTVSRFRGVVSSLVGRVQELTLLERHLAGEGPPVLLLAGEPGIGKTRLLREVVQMAQAGGWCVLEGGCHRSGGQEPYATLLGALERRIHHQPLGQLRILSEIQPLIVAPEKLAGLPILVVQGAMDAVIPISSGRAAREMLSLLPVELTYHEYPTMGHEVSPESLADVETWLSAQLDRAHQHRQVT